MNSKVNMENAASLGQPAMPKLHRYGEFPPPISGTYQDLDSGQLLHNLPPVPSQPEAMISEESSAMPQLHLYGETGNLDKSLDNSRFSTSMCSDDSGVASAEVTSYWEEESYGNTGPPPLEDHHSRRAEPYDAMSQPAAMIGQNRLPTAVSEIDPSVLSGQMSMSGQPSMSINNSSSLSGNNTMSMSDSSAMSYSAALSGYPPISRCDSTMSVHSTMSMNNSISDRDSMPMNGSMYSVHPAPMTNLTTMTGLQTGHNSTSINNPNYINNPNVMNSSNSTNGPNSMTDPRTVNGEITMRDYMAMSRHTVMSLDNQAVSGHKAAQVSNQPTSNDQASRDGQTTNNDHFQLEPYSTGSNYVEYKANQPFEEVVQKSFEEYKPDSTYQMEYNQPDRKYQSEYNKPDSTYQSQYSQPCSTYQTPYSQPDGTYHKSGGAYQTEYNQSEYKMLESLEPGDTDVYVMKESAPSYNLGRSTSNTSVASMSLGKTLANSLNLITSGNLPQEESPAAYGNDVVEEVSPPSPEPAPVIKPETLLPEPQPQPDPQPVSQLPLQPAGVMVEPTTPIPLTLLVPPISPEDKNAIQPVRDSYSMNRLDAGEEPYPISIHPLSDDRRGRKKEYSETSQFVDFKMKTIVVPKAEISLLEKDHSVELSKNLLNGVKCFKDDSILSKDSLVTLYQCDICNKLFHRKQTLRQHFITHTDRFPCPHCEVRCKSKGDLRSHIQTHTKEKPFHCHVCNTNYTRESILRKHQTTQSHIKMEETLRKIQRSCRRRGSTPIDESLSCKMCPKVFYSQQQLRNHTKVHSLRYKCKLCAKRCLSVPLLKLHMKSHDKNNTLSCKECSRCFQNVFLLKEHMKSHKRKQEVVVEVPRIKIQEESQEVMENMWRGRSESQMSKNRGRRRPKQAKEVKFSCQLCGKGYINRKSLENHENVHHKYNCTICEKKYPSLSLLKVHMKLHGKPYTCDICDSPFFDHGEFKDHVDSHCRAGEELSCKICYGRFTSSSDLEFHMQNHAPTMLFSGASLDASSIPVHPKRGKIKQESNMIRMSDSEDNASDNDDRDETTHVQEVKPLTKEEMDRARLFKKEGFLEYLSNVIVDVVTRPGVLEEGNNSDTELVDAIKTIVESDMLDSPYSSGDEGEPSPVVHSRKAILEKHSYEFQINSDCSVEQGRYRCQFCMKDFPESSHLEDHLVLHVCEWCNLLFPHFDECAGHREQHRSSLISQMKDEAASLGPRLCAEMFTSDDSESDEEGDVSDGFLSEMESLLDCGTLKQSQPALQMLSHDEIIRHNKGTFERYSCIDSTSGIFACTLCKRKYARPTTLTRHFKTHVCPHCNKFFEDKGDLIEHKFKHKLEVSGDDRKRGSMSPLISKANRELFKKFSFVDSEHNINRCTLCCKNFVRRTVLTRHMKTHICSRCNKFYEDKYDLAKHLIEHEQDAFYVGENQEAFVEYDADDEKPVPGSDPTKLYAIEPNFSHFTPTFHTQPGGLGGDNQTLTFIQIPGTDTPVEAQTSQMYTTTTPGGDTFQIISEPDTNPESFLVTAPTGSQNQSKIVTLSGGDGSGKMMTLGGLDTGKMMNLGGHDSSKLMTLDASKMMSLGAMDSGRMTMDAGRMTMDSGRMGMDDAKLMTLDNGKMVSLSGMDACNDKMVGMDQSEENGRFQCGDCGKRFYKNSHLKAHMLVHASSKPFSCRLCGKSFSKENTLKKHEKIHAKRCKICEATFNYKYELDMHMEIHRTYPFYK